LKSLLSGNEAIALGAQVSGVRVASAYPGTPSTEILEKLAGCEGIYAEWAPNEKVALDTGIGAAYTGVKALVAMKHVGLNVAADALFYAAYTGVPGGLVIVVADDPGMHSSQNEQDSRHYARFTKLPMLEPSNSQEAYEFVRLAFEISQQFECPVLIRTTTRVAHSKSMVEVGEYENGPHPQRPLRDGEGAFSPPPVGEGLGAGSAPSPTFGHVKGNPAQYVMVPANAKQRHVVVEQRLKQLEEYAESLDANAIELGDKRLGIITSSIAYNYAREVFPQASFLKLGMSYPLPSRKIKEFAASVDMLIVIEELDPFFEEQVRLLGLEVEGKSFIPLLDELSVDVIRAGAVKAGLVPEPAETQKPLPQDDFPKRPPVLCAGCGHRGVFYVLNKLKTAVMGDIGCYTVAVAPPLSAIHTTGCMGAGIGVLHGALKAGAEEPAVAVIGDSTFLHSGIAPLLNVVYNQSPAVVIILDNSTTAMTGHQDNPGTGKTLLRKETTAVDLEALVKALGVRNVWKVDPYDLKATERAIKEALAVKEPAVVIAEHPCLLIERKGPNHLAIDEERCNGCGLCQRLGCPAIEKEGGIVHINEVLCTGCGLCQQVCARKAVISR
jgi:indolepyruvate ferredoxin oxidoreductase alpha subunit